MNGHTRNDFVMATSMWDEDERTGGGENMNGPHVGHWQINVGVRGGGGGGGGRSAGTQQRRYDRGGTTMPYIRQHEEVRHDDAHYMDGPFCVQEDMPCCFRECFNFGFFNAVQSECFNDIFRSDRSMVVSAPTGAGKTTLFDLAMLKLLSRNNTDHTHTHFRHTPGLLKTVYLCPTKSLAQERVRDWNARFGKIGVVVEEITGDSEELSAQRMDGVDIVVATPERFDSITRNRSGSKAWFNEVALVCIDEVHLVGENRGACLEAIVSRLKLLKTLQSMESRPIGQLRFVAASATIPNVHELGKWLGDGTVVKTFGSELRPVKLSIHVESYKMIKNDYLFQNYLVKQLPNIARRFYVGRPMLIFCGSRKLTIDACNMLLKLLGPTFFLPSNQEACDQVRSAAATISSKPLSQLMSCGIAYHSAGLEASERTLVENEFNARHLGVVCTTTSLALGVNLPANVVIVMNTRLYESGAYTDIDSSTVLQMIGRAGRPGLDTQGTAVIMTNKESEEKFRNISVGNEAVESHLLEHFPEHLNAEIAMGSITNVDESLRWLQNSFLYVRIFSNPHHYKMPKLVNDNMIKERTKNICMRYVQELAEANMIELRQDNGIESCEAGKMMAKFYIEFKTMKSVVALPEHASMPDLLECICKSQELRNIRLRRSEKKVLNEINTSNVGIRFPVELKAGKAKKIQADFEKVQVLINATLSENPNHDLDPGMRADAELALTNGRRLARCMFEYFVGRGRLSATANAMLIARSFFLRLWDNTAHVTKQLGLKIGQKQSAILVNNGKTSFDKILAEDPHRLEQIMGRAYPFGSQLQSAISSLPLHSQLHIEISQENSMNGLLHVISSDVGAQSALYGGSVLDRSKSGAYLIVGCPETDQLFLSRYINFAEVDLPVQISFTRRPIPETSRATFGSTSIVAACIFEHIAGLDTNTIYREKSNDGSVRAAVGLKRKLARRDAPANNNNRIIITAAETGSENEAEDVDIEHGKTTLEINDNDNGNDDVDDNYDVDDEEFRLTSKTTTNGIVRRSNKSVVQGPSNLGRPSSLAAKSKSKSKSTSTSKSSSVLLNKNSSDPQKSNVSKTSPEDMSAINHSTENGSRPILIDLCNESSRARRRSHDVMGLFSQSQLTTMSTKYEGDTSASILPTRTATHGTGRMSAQQQLVPCPIRALDSQEEEANWFKFQEDYTSIFGFFD